MHIRFLEIWKSYYVFFLFIEYSSYLQFYKKINTSTYLYCKTYFITLRCIKNGLVLEHKQCHSILWKGWRTFIYLSILKKVTVAAAVTENGPPINEKTNSFRNTKFGTQIAFSMKMCKMPFSKIKDQWGPRWGPP